MDIAKIDKNFEIKEPTKVDGYVLYDIKQTDADLYGFDPNESGFTRMPEEVAMQCQSGVQQLYRNTAGVRARFSCDSQKLLFKVKFSSEVRKMSHMTLVGTAGFDLYIEDKKTEKSHFFQSVKPAWNITDEYTAEITFPDKRKRYLTLNFPLYSSVSSLQIGIEKDAVIGHGLPYRKIKPIVYYGSSITQGACASRPGIAYQNIIARNNNIDYRNFGFSGSAKGEQAMADYLATLPMSVFVSDYDHNSPINELKETHLNLYKTIRKSNPKIPYLIITKPDFKRQEHESAIKRRDYCYQTFQYAKAQGDKNVYYIDGESLWGVFGGDCATVDATHPNDYGMVLMAEKIGNTLEWIFLEKH